MGFKKQNSLKKAENGDFQVLGSLLYAHYPTYCPPPFRRKAEGHSFWLSVLPSVLPSVRPSVRPSFRPPIGVCTLCAQLLLQFYSDSFETLQCLHHALKMCMWFGYNTQINF